MKTLTKRNALLIVLSLVVAICSLTFAATVKPAKATGTAITIGTFEVMEEAQIRIGKGEDLPEGSSSGIRFRARIDQDTYDALVTNDTADNAYMGFLITPKAFFDQVTDGKYHESLTNYVNKKNDERGIVVDETNTFYQENGFWYTNGAVQGMLEKNINLEYTVVAYIYDGVSYQYRAPSADFSRTYTQVANKAILSGKNSAELVQSADYLSSFGTETNPVVIENKQDYLSFANGAKNNAFEGVYINIANSIDLGKEADGDSFATLPISFAGTLTASEGVSVTYESDAYTSLAENYQMVKDFYSCTFNADRDWTDKLIYAERVSGSTTPTGEPDTRQLLTEEVTFKDQTTGLDVTKTAAKLTYDANNSNRTFAAVDFGFELSGNVSATHITFTVGYKFKDGVTGHMAGNVIGGTVFNTQGALMSEELAFSDETIGTWMTFTYSLADAITIQSSYYPTRFEGMDGQACYVRLFRVLQTGTHKTYEIYIADVKFETAANLDPIVLTNVLDSGRTNTKTVFNDGLVSDVLASTTMYPNIGSDYDTAREKFNTKLAEIAAYDVKPCDTSDIYWFLVSNKDTTSLVISFAYTITTLKELGYTHLDFYIAQTTHTKTYTFTVTSSVIDVDGGVGSGFVFSKTNSGQWHKFTVDLDSLNDEALQNNNELLKIENQSSISDATLRAFYVYAEIVKN